MHSLFSILFLFIIVRRGFSVARKQERKKKEKKCDKVFYHLAALWGVFNLRNFNQQKQIQSLI